MAVRRKRRRRTKRNVLKVFVSKSGSMKRANGKRITWNQIANFAETSSGKRSYAGSGLRNVQFVHAKG